jgi:DNA helicase-2/ATP-dependent DNA helicase PcrA
VLEHALFNAALPYRVYGGMRFFERAEIKHALAYLRLVAIARRTTARSCASVNFPPRGIGRAHARAAAGGRARRRPTLWQAALLGRAVRQGGQLGRRVRALSSRCARRRAGCRCPEAVEHVIEASGLLGALPQREGRPGAHREPRGARQRGARLRARSGLAVDAPIATVEAPSVRAARTPAAAAPDAPPRRRRRRRDRSAHGVPRARALEAGDTQAAEGRPRCSS